MGWQGHEIKTPPILHLRKRNNHKVLIQELTISPQKYKIYIYVCLCLNYTYILTNCINSCQLPCDKNVFISTDVKTFTNLHVSLLIYLKCKSLQKNMEIWTVYNKIQQLFFTCLDCKGSIML